MKLMLCSGPRGNLDSTWLTLDNDPEVEPDHLFDLNRLQTGGLLPFTSGELDEIHCYNSMHMYGTQGDYDGWFAEWREHHRVLKSGGVFCGSVPTVNGRWTWSDPGAKRAVHPVNLKYLTEDFYQNKMAVRRYKKMVEGSWWEMLDMQETNDTLFFTMRTVWKH